MKRVLIWDTMGEILHICESEEEAEEVIEEMGYQELHRTQKDRDTNICVCEF